jgi:hypothetical protein
MTRYYPATHDPIVRHLFQCLMDDEQIGDRIGGVSAGTIRRARERLGLGFPAKDEQPNRQLEIPPRSYDPNNPMIVAHNTLGSRLTEVNGAYRLDNTPTKFFELMRETNRVLKQQGKDQIGPSDWRVP